MYDITSIPAYFSAAIFEYGHAKDHHELKRTRKLKDILEALNSIS